MRGDPVEKGYLEAVETGNAIITGGENGALVERHEEAHAHALHLERIRGDSRVILDDAKFARLNILDKITIRTNGAEGGGYQGIRADIRFFHADRPRGLRSSGGKSEKDQHQRGKPGK